MAYGLEGGASRRRLVRIVPPFTTLVPLIDETKEALAGLRERRNFGRMAGRLWPCEND
jgi:hypothetical protein